MEEIKIEKVVTEIKYKSVDGEIFNSAENCKKWEESYKGTLTLSWNQFPKIEVDGCGFGLPYAEDDKDCFMVVPKSMEDVVFLNAYVACVTSDSGPLFTREHIGEKMLMLFGYDYDYCDVYSVEDRLRSIKEYAEKQSAIYDEHYPTEKKSKKKEDTEKE